MMFSPFWCQILLALCCLSAVSAVNYDQYHTGDNYASFLELKSKMGSLNAGDTLIVHEGQYNFPASCDTGGSCSQFGFNFQGTKKGWITVRTADESMGEGDVLIVGPTVIGRQNTIDVQGTYYHLKGLKFRYGDRFRAMDSSYAIFEDLEIYDTHGGAMGFNTNGNTYDNIIIRGCELHDTGGHAEGMYLGCNENACTFSNSLVEGNYVHNTCVRSCSQGDGIELKEGGYNNIIRHNVVHDTTYPGIITYTTGSNPQKKNKVYGNYVRNSGDNCMQIEGDADVYNNIVVGCSNNGIESKDHQGVTRNLRIFHNTVLDADNYCLRATWSDDESYEVKNNAFYCGSGTDIYSPGGYGDWSGNVHEGSLNGAPAAGFKAGDQTTDIDSGYFPKKTGELNIQPRPARESSLDFNQNPRKTKSAIGAYEYSGGGNPGWTLQNGFKPVRVELDSVKALKVTSNKAKIKWAHRSATPNKFQLEVKQKGGEWVKTGSNISATKNHKKLTDLMPGTKYTARVRAVNSAGKGPWYSKSFTTDA
eukprot:TRINITY_DN16634_c0_g1_i1.p1 TRINITY_DN16634_c0_g1~~TRINITY_DN16634_c0_g1_i1.p1  ORF type:complete len:533 (+),score=67.25 TRINITY_DN16634_c0_g1_i1:138-1736(+)